MSALAGISPNLCRQVLKSLLAVIRVFKPFWNGCLGKEKYAESRQLPYQANEELKAIAVLPCDVTYDTAADIPESQQSQKGYAGVDASIQELMDATQKAAGGLDILIHSVAFSPEVDRSHLEVSRRAYLTAMSTSSYSLIALARAAAPSCPGAMVTWWGFLT